MSKSTAPPRCLRLLALSLGCALLHAPVFAGPQQAAPRVPGAGLEPELYGRILFEELRCWGCHDDGAHEDFARQPAPELRGLNQRVDAAWLTAFLGAPAEDRAGTRMPDLLGRLPEEERAAAALELTHALLSLDADPLESEGGSPEDTSAGRELFHSVGCVSCHAPRLGPRDGNGGRAPSPPDVGDAVPLQGLEQRHTRDSLSAFLFQPLHTRPDGRMPDLGLTRAEAGAIASYLLDGTSSTRADFELDPTQARLGSLRFEELGCAACHALDGELSTPAATPLDELDASRGCIAPSQGGADYALNDEQRTALRAFVEAQAHELSAAQRLQVTTTSLRCDACHERGGLGGPEEARKPYFGTDELDLGDHARFPPALDRLGAKLQPSWLRRVLFDGASVRPYMHTRMPRFGEHNLESLPALFAEVDAESIEPYAFRAPTREEQRPWRDAGRLMCGIRGLSCISCHDFNSNPAPGFRGLDLVPSTERLQPSWFARFLIAPEVLRPGIVMPQSWPGGEAVHSGILEGDTEAQINALWFYLSQGRTASNPEGISSPATKLEVAQEARLYRGRSGIAGFRGIAVGLPGGLNYAFDAHTGSLAGVWSGEFVSVNWNGQAAGDFRPAARAHELARDISLWAMPDPDAPWPLRPRTDRDKPVDPDPLYARRHGYRFGGYHFDGPLALPTLEYAIGAVQVQDRSEALASEDSLVLARTLRFEHEGAGSQRLVMRLLVGEFEEQEAGRYRQGRLILQLPELPHSVRALPEAGRELLLELSIPSGTTNLRLDYALQD